MLKKITTWAAHEAASYMAAHWPNVAKDICEALERSLLGTQRGRERMALAVGWVRSYLPWYLRLLVQDKAVEAIVQAAFDAVEDKLDEIAAREGDRAA